MCECGMYVQLDFKSAWNNLAHAGGMKILGDGRAALRSAQREEGLQVGQLGKGKKHV